MAPPRNPQQDLTSLRLRLQEAYEELSNTPIPNAQRHKKFQVLQTLTHAQRALDRLKESFYTVVVEEPKPNFFIAYALRREEIAIELNQDYTEEHQLKDDDPRLTDEFCKEFASGYGNCLGEAAGHFHGDMYEMEMWSDFMKEMHEKIGATRDWFHSPSDAEVNTEG